MLEMEESEGGRKVREVKRMVDVGLMVVKEEGRFVL